MEQFNYVLIHEDFIFFFFVSLLDLRILCKCDKNICQNTQFFRVVVKELWPTSMSRHTIYDLFLLLFVFHFLVTKILVKYEFPVITIVFRIGLIITVTIILSE